MRTTLPILTLTIVLLLISTSGCNKAYNLSQPSYEGWGELVLREGKAPIRPERAKLFFSANEIPAEFERIVMITAPVRISQVTAADWEKARHYAAFHGANGVFLQSNTAAFQKIDQVDQNPVTMRPEIQDRMSRNMANFFGVKY